MHKGLENQKKTKPRVLWVAYLQLVAETAAWQLCLAKLTELDELNLG